jgi:outer membrane protein assembly factor BamD
MKKNFFILSLAIVAIWLVGCSSNVKNLADKYQGQSANELYSKAEQALATKHYKDAVEYFEALQTIYPFGIHAEKTQLDLIYAYYKTNDNVSTVAAAERFIRLYPRSEHVDYAMYMRGLANFQQKRGILQNFFYTDLSQRDFGTMTQSFADFKLLLERFPHSKYAPDAYQRMVYLRDMFAKHEVDTARFYLKRKAYVAANNRASYVVQHLQGASSVKDALVIIVQANRSLGLDKPANDALQVLKLNYPQAAAKL